MKKYRCVLCNRLHDENICIRQYPICKACELRLAYTPADTARYVQWMHDLRRIQIHIVSYRSLENGRCTM